VTNLPVEASSLRKFGLLASLYAAQGLPFGFFTQALPVFMRQQNYSLRWIGLTSLLALPWALKWTWAPLVDRYHSARWGRRRSWLLPLQALSVATLVLLAVTGEHGGLPLLLLGCFVTNAMAATQDVATDGLAVEVLTDRERGIGNGIQVAGYRLGMIVGGGVLLIVFEQRGWTPTLGLMAGLLALCSVPIWLHREKTNATSSASGSRGLSSWLRRSGSARWLLVLGVFKTGDALATAMMKPYLVDSGLSMADVGWLIGSIGSITGLLGALAGGVGSSRWGTRRALLVFGLLSAASVGGYALAAFGTPTFTQLALLSGFEHFAGGMATVALFTEMMSHCRRGSEGNDYTVQASIVVLATGAAHSLSGFVAEPLGYASHFGLCAVIAAGGALTSWWLLPSIHALRRGTAEA